MTVLGAIVAICAGVVSIATGLATLWKKITESEAKQQLAQKEAALATCQQVQVWQWAILFAVVIAFLILASRSPALRA